MKTQRIVVCGSDSRAAWRYLQAIRARFLARSDSMADLVDLDLSECEPSRLEQAVLSVPFLVSHRLFILRRPFTATRAMQEKLIDLLPKLPPTTVAVLFEPQAADGRLKLWRWLKAHATVVTRETPEGHALKTELIGIAKQFKVGLDDEALSLLVASGQRDMWWFEQEICKLAALALSRGETNITAAHIGDVGAFQSKVSVFDITDALRCGNVPRGLGLLERLALESDPMATAGMLASMVRTVAKLALADPKLPAARLADQVGVHPYVVTLSLPAARRLGQRGLLMWYRHLLAFEVEVKSGKLPPEIALTLLAARLGGSLK